MLITFTDKPLTSDQIIKKSVEEYCSLADIPSFPFSIIRIDGKKPYMSPDTLQFNLSHSNGVTVCAVGTLPIGVDVQYHKKVDFIDISKRFFSRATNDEDTFFNEWASKEATAKLSGISCIKTLKLDCNCTIIPFFANYTLAVASTDKGIILTELR